MKRKSETDWNRIDSMKDEDIDLSDIPEMGDEFFKNATVMMPEPKASVTLRVDREVLEWFKCRGKGYQTRMNAVLKAYVTAHREQRRG